MAFTIYQYNGLTLNDANYSAVIRNDAPIVPSASPSYVYRPGAHAAYAGAYLKEYTIPIVITILKADKEAGRKELLQYFAVDDPVKRLLSVKDGSAAQWDWYGKPINVIQESDDLMTVVIAIDNPWLVRNTEVTASVNIPGGGYSLGMTYTSGNKTAYPRFRIKPTSHKAGGFAYSRHVHIYSNSASAFTNYPFDICNASFNTNALVTASKMQADGDDLRVFVDGVEVDRWLSGINTANTKAWVNLNFSPKQEATLSVALASSGALTSIVASTTIAGFPSSGDLLIDSERFLYTSKDDASRTFSGITRAVRGTSEAAHSAAATIRWIEHEIVIKYGDAAAVAPVTDNTRMPMFALTSTNTSWAYADFGGDGVRSGDWWTFIGASGGGTSSWSYTNARNTGATGVVLGITTDGTKTGEWQFTHPAGITGWNFANGEKRATAIYAAGHLDRKTSGGVWALEYTIPAIATINTWESWSDNRASLGATAYTIRMMKGATKYLEVSDVTLTLVTTAVPTTAIGAEEEKYYLNCTISDGTNSLTINGYPMALNEHLEIDCNLFTVTHVESGANAIGYLQLNDETRQRWLSLPTGGVTTFTYSETNLVAVTMTIDYKPVSTYL